MRYFELITNTSSRWDAFFPRPEQAHMAVAGALLDVYVGSRRTKARFGRVGLSHHFDGPMVLADPPHGETDETTGETVFRNADAMRGKVVVLMRGVEAFHTRATPPNRLS